MTNPCTNTDIRIPAEAFSPGDYLREELAARGVSQAQLARRMGCSQQTITALLQDRRAVTPRLAAGLAVALGISAEFWIALEAVYQQHGERRCAWCGAALPMRPRRERFCGRHCATWYRVEGSSSDSPMRPIDHDIPGSPHDSDVGHVF